MLELKFHLSMIASNALTELDFHWIDLKHLPNIKGSNHSAGSSEK